MLALLNAVIGLSSVVMLMVYVMYFTALHHFGKSLHAKHPDIYAQFQSVPGGHFARSYAARQGLRKDSSLSAQLEPSVAAELSDTYRYLVVGLAMFMVLLLAGLGNALIAKA